jgi:hypothetical protein
VIATGLEGIDTFGCGSLDAGRDAFEQLFHDMGDTANRVEADHARAALDGMEVALKDGDHCLVVR